MRFGLVLIFSAWLSAPSALAQSTAVAIPFAPRAPASFVIDEVRTRTFTEGGETRTRSGRVRSTLEISAHNAGAYGAVWTTNSAEPAAIVIDNGGADPTLLVGERISLTLDESGAPLAFSDWRSIRRGMFRIMLEHERDPFWRRAYTATERAMAQWSPEIAAQTLMETLSILSACHNTDLAPGAPESLDLTARVSFGALSIPMRATWELEGVDTEASVARIIHTRAPEMASFNARAAASKTGLVFPAGSEGEGVDNVEHRTECVVDLQSGVTRSATFEIRMSVGGETDIRRRVITVTPAER